MRFIIFIMEILLLAMDFIIQMCSLAIPFLMGALVVIVVSSIIHSLIDAAMAKMYGFLVKNLSLMGISWIRDGETGRYVVRFDKFSFASECLVTLDVTKPMTEELLEKADKNEIKCTRNSAIVSSIIIAILSILSFIYFHILCYDHGMKYVPAFLFGLGLCFAWNAVTYISVQLKP